MPEVLRVPHLGIMSELLTCLACLAVARGLELLAHLRWGDLVVFEGGQNGQYVRYGYQCTYT